MYERYGYFTTKKYVICYFLYSIHIKELMLLLWYKLFNNFKLFSLEWSDCVDNVIIKDNSLNNM